ncbi:isoprenylcysteine carboxylmethyltransferase family protein [Methylobacter sp. BBA5.1]|uniref:methyltransferase family protein n=1 Tax=Methylobacter sp. BBA5.1 TaxID=1495064 RepID=UPI0005626561|nr:isoprenylcysteine carboxylmethyltransferase family protein [Methylobacter sp. BBA5.1]
MQSASITPLSRFLVSTGNVLYHARKMLLPGIAIALIIMIKPFLFLGSHSLDQLMVILGIMIALAGEVLRLATIGFAYIHRGGKNRQVYATKLVVKGLYSHTRNPMYVGNFLITMGLSLLYGSPLLSSLIFLSFGFVYLAVISAEEDFLRKKFGQEFETYTKTVNRFWPNLRGLSRTLREFDHYNWRKALDKETGTIVEALLIGVALVAWKTYALYGFENSHSVFAVLAVVFLLAVALSVLVNYLRKTGRLVSDLHNEHSDLG